MFGSNFDANFGLPDFGFQGTDPQGGYLGANAPTDATGLNLGGGPVPTAGGQPGQQPANLSPQTSIAAPSPLAAGPLSSAGAQPAQQPGQPAGDVAAPPPAAGLGSPFGKPAV